MTAAQRRTIAEDPKAGAIDASETKLAAEHESDPANRLTSVGARHVDIAVEDIAVDEDNRIVTTPAYMLATRISDAASGIERLCAKIVSMAN